MSPGRGTESRNQMDFMGHAPFTLKNRQNIAKNGTKQGMEERKWNRILFWKCVI